MTAWHAMSKKWNIGMMEYWNIGRMDNKIGSFLPTIPLFHHSIIPSG